MNHSTEVLAYIVRCCQLPTRAAAAGGGGGGGGGGGRAMFARAAAS